MASKRVVELLRVSEEVSTAGAEALETQALYTDAGDDAGHAGRLEEARRTHVCLLPGLVFCAMLSTFFTNLQPVPVCSVLAPLCILAIAEKIERISNFLCVLLLIGLVFGVSTYGYLFEASFVIGILLHLTLSGGFVAHRTILRRHPDTSISLLAFPCLHVSVFVLVMYITPIGSVGNPAYSVTSLSFLVQVATIFGRSGVTFLLDWTAACLAHAIVVGVQHPVAKRSLRSCLLVWLLSLLFGALRVYSPHLFLDISEWDGAIAADSHQISCLSGLYDMYHQTEKRLAAGDTIVIHSERSTSSRFDKHTGGTWHATIARYENLLQDNYAKSGIEAVVVLSFKKLGKSWYHLVSRHGSLMKYAKNHPVPLVEIDIVGGDYLPSVVSVPLGRPSGSRAPVFVTGSICFDTDFPSLTRQLGGADLFLETSATWFNIGEEHFQGHLYTAIENGVTLVKCTQDGVTGVFDAFGNVLFRFPQTSGVSIFSVPRFQHVPALPIGGYVFDAVVCFSSLFWLILCISPAVSRRVLPC